MDTSLSLLYMFRPYALQLHDRPLEQVPAQRIQKEGPEVLTVNELLHLALGKGDELEPVLSEYGAKFLTTLRSVNEIVEALGLDRVQACRLLSILELGKRLYGQSQGGLITVRGIEDVYEHYRFMASAAKEQLRVLLVNSRFQVIHEEVLAIGSIDGLAISPRDVFQPAVERRVTGIILIHNHPSNSPEPSDADLALTEAVDQAGKLLGITLLDHVVIGQDGAASCLHPGSRISQQ